MRCTLYNDIKFNLVDPWFRDHTLIERFIKVQKRLAPEIDHYFLDSDEDIIRSYADDYNTTNTFKVGAFIRLTN